MLFILKFWSLKLRLCLGIKLRNFLSLISLQVFAALKFIFSYIFLFHICCYRNSDESDDSKVSCAEFSKFYRFLNLAICFPICLGITSATVAFFEDELFLSKEHWLVIAMYVFLLCMHSSRAVWLNVAIKLRLKIVEDVSAYELERIASLSWAGIIAVAVYRMYSKDCAVDDIIDVFAEWFTGLLLLSPTVSLVGSSWRKLYVDSGSGKVYWPRCPKCSVS